jgi:hypothetical protein
MRQNSGGCRWLYNGLPEANKASGLSWQLVTPIQVMFQHFILSDSLMKMISILIVMFSSKMLLWRFYCKLVDAFLKVVSPFWSLALWNDHNRGSLGWNLFSLEFQLVMSYTTTDLKIMQCPHFQNPNQFMECECMFYGHFWNHGHISTIKTPQWISL